MRHEQILQSWCLARVPTSTTGSPTAGGGTEGGAREGGPLRGLLARKTGSMGQVMVRSSAPWRVIVPRLIWSVVTLLLVAGVPACVLFMGDGESGDVFHLWGVVSAAVVVLTWIVLALCWLPHARGGAERGYQLVWHAESRALEVVTRILGIPVRRTRVPLDDVALLQVTFVHCEACVRVAQVGDAWTGADQGLLDEPTVRVILKPGAAPAIRSWCPSCLLSGGEAASDSVVGGTYDFEPTERFLASLGPAGMVPDLVVERVHHRAGYCGDCTEQLARSTRRREHR